MNEGEPLDVHKYSLGTEVDVSLTGAHNGWMASESLPWSQFGITDDAAISGPSTYG